MIPSIPQISARLGCRGSPGRFYSGQQSLDLNPIGNLWWDLKKAVAAHKPKNITGLEAKIPQKRCQKLVSGYTSH